MLAWFSERFVNVVLQALIDEKQTDRVATYTATLPPEIQTETYAYFLEGKCCLVFETDISFKVALSIDMYFSNHHTSTQHSEPNVLKYCLVDIVDMKQRQKCLELASSAGMCIDLSMYVVTVGFMFHRELRRLNIFFVMYVLDCITVCVYSSKSL